jgi:hypothetical protein
MRWVARGTYFLENISVAAMLRMGPAGVSDDLINAASRWTMLKSVGSTVAMFALLLMLGWWLISRWRRRPLA